MIFNPCSLMTVEYLYKKCICIKIFTKWNKLTCWFAYLNDESWLSCHCYVYGCHEHSHQEISSLPCLCTGYHPYHVYGRLYHPYHVYGRLCHPYHVYAQALSPLPCLCAGFITLTMSMAGFITLTMSMCRLYHPSPYQKLMSTCEFGSFQKDHYTCIYFQQSKISISWKSYCFYQNFTCHETS